LELPNGSSAINSAGIEVLIDSKLEMRKGQRWDFDRLAYDKYIDYIRATVPNLGGITEMVKIVATAYDGDIFWPDGSLTLVTWRRAPVEQRYTYIAREPMHRTLTVVLTLAVSLTFHVRAGRVHGAGPRAARRELEESSDVHPR
jgi:hypothetical protein